MVNLFFPHDPTTPKTVRECKTPDPMSTELWIFAERLQMWGMILFYIILIIGVIATAVATISVYNVDKSLAIGTALSSAIDYGLAAFGEYIAYHSLILLFGALATNTQSRSIMARVALYNAAKDQTVDEGQTVCSTKTIH